MENQLKYTLGLDIGIASVGWSVINNDKNRIENLGVRIFDKAESPQDGSPLAEPRRIARSTRRRLRRRKYRMQEIKKLIVHSGMITENAMDVLYDNSHLEFSPWQLRAQALERKLTNEEMSRVLIHIAKRRGYKSNRKSEQLDESSESGKMNSSIQRISMMLTNSDSKYTTVGEMFAKDEKFSQHKRNKSGGYEFSISRKLLIDELKVLFEKQREFGNEFLTTDFEKKYMDLFEFQYSFASKEQIEKMIGKCTFEKEEKRTPKAGYTPEKFTLLQKVNNIKIVGRKEQNLTAEERKKIIDLSYKNAKVTYAQIRKELQLNENEKFNSLKYYIKGKRELDKKDIKEIEKVTFIELKFKNALKNKITNELSNEVWESIKDNESILDNIGIALTLYKTDADIIEYLEEKNVDKQIINAVLSLSFTKVMHLSLKAIKNILPYLENGYTYDKACELAGYDFRASNLGEKTMYLPVITKEEVRNPVVLRALSQTRKVINGIIRTYGSPYKIHIEFGREVAKSRKERDVIENNQKENRNNNEKIKNVLKSLYPKEFSDKEPNSNDVLKYKLAQEQLEKCMYSQEALDMKRLFEVGYVEIDHAIPYSRCFNDSYMNKVLVLSKENQNKGNRIPFEYLKDNKERWESYSRYVWSLNIPLKKKQMITKEKFTTEEAREFKDRNINDTRYIARFMKNYIENNLLFNDFGDKDNRKQVLVINGQMTAFLRHCWGLTKVRDASDVHHALDATVIATATQKNINNISQYYKAKNVIQIDHKVYDYDEETGELVEVDYQKQKYVPQPWEHFRDELQQRLMSEDGTGRIQDDFYIRLNEYIKLRPEAYDDIETSTTTQLSEETKPITYLKPIMVSRAPKRKVTGAAHAETVRSKKVFNAERSTEVCVKTPLTSIKKSTLENMVGKETDPLTYNLILQRLNENGDNPQKAFKEPLYKTKDGKPDGKAPLIRSIKIKSVINHGVEINKGIAGNESMVRVDVFEKDGKNYLVPIYVSDTKKKELPNRAITQAKDYEEWTIIDDTYNFKFSLYSNDIIKVKNKSTIKVTYNDGRKEEVTELMGYYKTTMSSTGSIHMISLDNSFETGNVGIKVGNIVLEKYAIDPLGKVSLIKKEKRVGFSNN